MSSDPVQPARRANIVGLGLIGGSVALALRQSGWTVSGSDRDSERCDVALAKGIVDAIGLDPAADLTIVAVPVTAAAAVVREALAVTTGLVTDVGSVKGPLANAIEDPRFVPGHPMAGSERLGLDGADPEMFRGAVWILTPNSATADSTFTEVAGIVGGFGAEVVALPAEQHDVLVAMVSHVPHLTAVSLMRLADARATDHAALLRLAAGGFRDMTRIASGTPAIWPDICAENKVAICDTLDALINELGEVRDLVRHSKGDELRRRLEQARAARENVPVRANRPETLAEVRVPIPDRPGSAAELFTLAAQLGVNIDSFEVVHSVEGPQGIAILLIDAERSELYRGGLLVRGYRPSIQRLQ